MATVDMVATADMVRRTPIRAIPEPPILRLRTQAVTQSHPLYTRPRPPPRLISQQDYEPGDGYRYPLYYDPTSGQHIYYPGDEVI